MATNYTNDAGNGYVIADGFAGPSTSNNPNAPAYSSPSFPGGLTLPTSAVDTTTDNITAHAGGGKANATALTTTYNRVTTVATTADSVLLYPAVKGQFIAIMNTGANPLQAFGQGTDTINGVATGTGVAIANGKLAEFVCYTTGAWFGPVALA